MSAMTWVVSTSCPKVPWKYYFSLSYGRSNDTKLITINKENKKNPLYIDQHFFSVDLQREMDKLSQADSRFYIFVHYDCLIVFYSLAGEFWSSRS